MLFSEIFQRYLFVPDPIDESCGGIPLREENIHTFCKKPYDFNMIEEMHFLTYKLNMIWASYHKNYLVCRKRGVKHTGLSISSWWSKSLECDQRKMARESILEWQSSEQFYFAHQIRKQLHQIRHCRGRALAMTSVHCPGDGGSSVETGVNNSTHDNSIMAATDSRHHQHAIAVGAFFLNKITGSGVLKMESSKINRSCALFWVWDVIATHMKCWLCVHFTCY